jgi:hypothetical protein
MPPNLISHHVSSVSRWGHPTPASSLCSPRPIPKEADLPDREPVVGVGRKVVVVGFGDGGGVVQVMPVEWPDYRRSLDLKD